MTPPYAPAVLLIHWSGNGVPQPALGRSAARRDGRPFAGTASRSSSRPSPPPVIRRPGPGLPDGQGRSIYGGDWLDVCGLPHCVEPYRWDVAYDWKGHEREDHERSDHAARSFGLTWVGIGVIGPLIAFLIAGSFDWIAR